MISTVVPPASTLASPFCTVLVLIEGRFFTWPVIADFQALDSSKEINCWDSVGVWSLRVWTSRGLMKMAMGRVTWSVWSSISVRIFLAFPMWSTWLSLDGWGICCRFTPREKEASMTCLIGLTRSDSILSIRWESVSEGFKAFVMLSEFSSTSGLIPLQGFMLIQKLLSLLR